jgi:hypothetical protein
MRMSLDGTLGSRTAASKFLHASAFGLMLLASNSFAQTQVKPPYTPEAKPNEQLQVNWLYGAYVSKDVPLQSLSNHQRFQLFLRQSFTTPGVYLKTAFFPLSDQAANSPPEWGNGFGGYAKRAGSRYGQFVARNVLAGLGNGLLGYEPRYNRSSAAAFGHAHAMLLSGTS